MSCLLPQLALPKSGTRLTDHRYGHSCKLLYIQVFNLQHVLHVPPWHVHSTDTELLKQLRALPSTHTLLVCWGPSGLSTSPTGQYVPGMSQLFLIVLCIDLLAYSKHDSHFPYCNITGSCALHASTPWLWDWRRPCPLKSRTVTQERFCCHKVMSQSYSQ